MALARYALLKRISGSHLIILALMGVLLYAGTVDLIPAGGERRSPPATSAASRQSASVKTETGRGDVFRQRTALVDGLGDSAAALTRPLFDPERRPWRHDPEASQPPAENRATSQPPSEALSFRLVGVAMSEEGAALAIVADPDHPERRLMRIGERLGAWRLARIAVDSIVLERRGETQTLALFPPTSAQAPR